MKKAGLYTFSLGCLLIYALSLNRSFMEWWADYRVYKLEAPHVKALYGDLYSNCFLPCYIDTAYIPLKEINSSFQNTNLYIIHDSYLEDKLKKENFDRVNILTMLNYNDPGIEILPDTSKRNILIIECSERTAEWRLSDTSTIFSKIQIHSPTLNSSESPFAEEKTPFLTYLFNPYINQNLELSIYDYEYFIPIKSLKSKINFSLFNRLPKDVYVSTDKKYLLLNETVDPTLLTSSFTPLISKRIDLAAFCMNLVSTYYKDNGFDEVYFSVIPNPVSIIDQFRMPYNHKIETLYTHPDLKSKYIDIYNLFRSCNYAIYRTDDSHWNGKGIQLWVDEVNKKLTP